MNVRLLHGINTMYLRYDSRQYTYGVWYILCFAFVHSLVPVISTCNFSEPHKQFKVQVYSKIPIT